MVNTSAKTAVLEPESSHEVDQDFPLVPQPTLPALPGLTPRDAATLNQLKQMGLVLVELKISQLSPALGQWLGGIELPEQSQVVCVARQGKRLHDLEGVFLQPGDSVFVMTDNERWLRQFFCL